MFFDDPKSLRWKSDKSYKRIFSRQFVFLRRFHGHTVSTEVSAKSPIFLLNDRKQTVGYVFFKTNFLKKLLWMSWKQFWDCAGNVFQRSKLSSLKFWNQLHIFFSGQLVIRKMFSRKVVCSFDLPAKKYLLTFWI